MSNSLQVNLSQPIAGLGTFSFTVVTAGFYTLACESFLPFNSGLTMVLKQNASAIVTIGGAATNPTPTQLSMGSSARIQASAADVLSVVLSSSAAADQIPNAVKSIVNLFQGQ